MIYFVFSPYSKLVLGFLNKFGLSNRMVMLFKGLLIWSQVQRASVVGQEYHSLRVCNKKVR